MRAGLARDFAGSTSDYNNRKRMSSNTKINNMIWSTQKRSRRAERAVASTPSARALTGVTGSTGFSNGAAATGNMGQSYYLLVSNRE